MSTDPNHSGSLPKAPPPTSIEAPAARRVPWLKYALAGIAVIVAALYFSGRLDYALYPIGLNLHQCGRNGFGATFCGADLTAYENRWRGVQQQISQTQRTFTTQECQIDPSLSFCP